MTKGVRTARRRFMAVARRAWRGPRCGGSLAPRGVSAHLRRRGFKPVSSTSCSNGSRHTLGRAHDGGRADGFIRLSDVPAGGVRAGDGGRGGVSLRLAPAALARASKEAAGLMVVDMLPQGGAEGGAPAAENLGALLARLHAAVARGEAPILSLP